MNFPDNLKYTKDHEWVLVDGDVATIGVTDFAQSELGDIVFVDISSQGDTLAAHGVFGTVEAVKTVSDLYMPVSGEVIEVNTNMDASPESVNSDPYGDGWMVKVKMSSPSEVDGLMSHADYVAMVG
ncbi:MAG: glycine cleavage system protein GcvH [Bacteroidetes bacterium]|nr:glycine cleavage system protein GcvH [Bacteroidota bacterium]